MHRRRRFVEVYHTLKRDFEVYRLLWRHERTPRSARWLLGLALGYILLPIDLIPDALPFIGHLDDILIVPGLIALALRLIPEDLVAACREAVAQTAEATDSTLPASVDP